MMNGRTGQVVTKRNPNLLVKVNVEHGHAHPQLTSMAYLHVAIMMIGNIKNVLQLTNVVSNSN